MEPESLRCKPIIKRRSDGLHPMVKSRCWVKAPLFTKSSCEPVRTTVQVPDS